MNTANSALKAADQAEFYFIRILVKHPSWSAAEITARLGEKPDRSWSAGENGKPTSMWSRSTRTVGERLFFREVSEVLRWVQSKGQFSQELRSSGGSLCVIAELPGAVNVGDVLEPEAMQLASKLGVEIGVEVFPGLRSAETPEHET